MDVFISFRMNILFSFQFCIIIVLVPTVKKVYCLNLILICMHLFVFKSYKYFVFFSILYDNRLSNVFYSYFNCFEVSETLNIGFVFALFQINQTYPILLDPFI